MKVLFSIIAVVLIGTAGFSQKMFSCDSKYDADIKVYVCDSKYDADKKIYFVSSKYDADLIIYFCDSKYDAKWNNASKKHLIY